MRTAMQTYDKKYLSIRHRQLNEALEPYRKHMAHILLIMPVKFIVTENGAEQIISPEWQLAIDTIKNGARDMIKQSFPEFISPDDEIL